MAGSNPTGLEAPASFDFASPDGSAYRLELTTWAVGAFGDPMDLAPMAFCHDLAPHVVVVSEQHSGMTAFLSWLKTRRQDGVHFVPNAGAFQRLFGSEELTPDPSGSPVTVFVVEPAWPAESLALLARLMEDPKQWATLGTVVCVATTLDPFLATLTEGARRSSLELNPFSRILARARVCRLPRFTVDELRRKWFWRARQADLPGDLVETMGDAVAHRCFHWVGGQPYLTDLFLARLVEVLREAPAPALAADQAARIESCGRWLRDHPPTVVQRWLEALEALVKDPETRRLVSGYAAGRCKRKGDTFELPDIKLFLAGWAGETTPGIWSLRSQCLRAWLQQKLRGAP